MPNPVIAYCGPAAFPGDVWARWTIDPLLLATLAALAFAVGGGRSRDARAGWGAIMLLLIVFVSPLCALSSALLSARILHHVLLIAAAAPLLALAFPREQPGSPPLSALVVVHALIVWLWHAPGAYAWGLASVPAYWLMQGSLLGSAWLMWRAILAPAARPGPALVALGATIGQMGLLGALIVFASRPLYAVHFASTWTWGFTPLADQQLAGLLLWVPALLPYFGVGLWIAWSGLRPGEPASWQSS
jgi:putative membrane protein